MFLVLLVCSLVSGTQNTFQYQPPYSRSNEPCKICYGEDCLPMDQVRCEYYMETEGILHEDLEGEDDPGVKAEVDGLLYSFMEKASATPTECIPLVSQYTDCTKENICIGCKSCSCDVHGKWNCTRVTKCRADDTMDVDHRMLVVIMENVMNAGANKRTKRSIQESLNKVSTNKISFDDISRWMLEEPPTLNAEVTTKNNTTYYSVNQTIINTISEITTQEVNTISDTSMIDYLGFDEVLNNIAVDSKSYSRRKPLVHNDSIAFDYLLFDEDNTTNFVTDRAEYENIKNNYAPSNNDEAKEVVIDLLESAKNNQDKTLTANWTDYTETDSKINLIDPTLDYIDNLVLGSKYIMKRDISNINETEITTKKTNIINNVIELKNNVLMPLSNIINYKQKELEELLRVSENLISIMRSYKNQPDKTNLQQNENVENTNSSISIYNIEITPELENESRRSDKNLLQKYIIRLKRDIYEVIRDVAGIQKLKDAANIPQDLKTLLQAMKHYVYSQAMLKDKEQKSDILVNRRSDKTNNTSNKTAVIDEILDILKVIDRRIPERNSLAPLSTTSRKIIYRVIKNNYVNEFSVIGSRVLDPEYNLTKDLGKIGTEWPRMTNIIEISAVNDKLYAMKLLHLYLSRDITKMNDALALLEFAYSRRMLLVEGNSGGEMMERINKGLKAINEKIKIIIKLHNNKQISKQRKIVITKNGRKESFLTRLKNILKRSKSDILSMLKKKVPKKEIVKGLAKKKLNEITRRRLMEFEDTMNKWQSDLNIVPRDKRFAQDDNYRNRIKNILPKYLRGKVKPVIAAKKIIIMKENIGN